MKMLRINEFSEGGVSRAGFTLVELMVVIGIMAMLAAIILPGLHRSREKAMQVYCMSNIKQLTNATVMYTQEHKAPPKAESRFLDDFTLIYPYVNELQSFVCPGNPHTVGELKSTADLVGKTDYMCWQGDNFEDLEKNGNDNNGHGNNLNVCPYFKNGKFDPSNPKFARVLADKIKVSVIYDFCGPAHCDTINISYVKDTHVLPKADMCDLWTLDSNGYLRLDSAEPWPPPRVR